MKNEEWASLIRGLASSCGSLRKLAKMAGIPRETIRALAAGRSEPSQSTERKIQAFMESRSKAA